MQHFLADFFHAIAVVVFLWLAESALYQELSGSIPAPSKIYSREPAVLKFVSCKRTQKKMEDLKTNKNLIYAAVKGLSIVLGH